MRKMYRRIISYFLVCMIFFNTCVPLTVEAAAVNDYTQWLQSDSEWNQHEAWPANQFLEASYRMMRDAGCLVTSIAMLLRHYNVVTTSDVNQFNPWICNEVLKSAGAFDENADLIWTSVKNAYPNFVYQGNSSYSFSTLTSLFNQGYACIVQVEGSPQHYVAVQDVSGSTVTIMDPGSGKTLLSQYSDPTAILYFKTSDSPLSDGSISTPVIVDKLMSEEGEVWYTVDGIVGGQIKFDSSTGTITDCEEKVTEAVIPQKIAGINVTSIGDSAFFDCCLKNVEIPDSVTDIGKYAFEFCSSLKNVVIPDSVTGIGEDTFRYCTSLENVEISDSVTSIGDGAFWGCESLKNVEIPDSVTDIGEDTFRYCTSLENVEIPDSVTSIGDSAFSDCRSLKNVEIPDSVTDIGKYTFQFCTSLENVEISDSVTSIGDGAFWGCQSLKNVEIPDSVKEIGPLAFEDCRCLQSVTLPDIMTNIGFAAFSDCYNLVNINLPKGITSIGPEFFSSCYSLTNIEIPEGVNIIGDWAFGECRNLKSVIFYGDAVAIAEDAFDRLTATMYYPSGNATWTEEFMQDYSGNLNWVPYEYDTTEQMCGEHLSYELSEEGILTISGIGLMDDWAEETEVPWYSEREQIKKVIITSGVMSVGNYAFKNCVNIEEELTFPKSILSVGDYAFSGCTGLKDIYVLSGTTNIADSAFIKYTDDPESFVNLDVVFHCPTDSNIYNWAVEKGFEAVEESKEEGEVWYTVDGIVGGQIKFDSSTGTITYCEETVTEAVIPQKIAGVNVTSIGDYAFSDCSSLKNVVIPNSVTSIGDCAFSDCRSLKNVVIPNSVTSIGDCAFSYCRSLKNVVIPDGVTDIGERTFAYCPSLENVEIPDSVTSIGDCAFSGCTGLKDIYVSSGTTNIADSAFIKDWSGPESFVNLDVIFHCPKDSDVYNWAIEKGFEAVAFEESKEEFSIIVHPMDQVTAEGEKVIFFVEAVGEGLSYQWQYSTNGKTWYNSGMTGAKTESLTVEATTKRNGQQYRCQITDANGEKLVSEAASLMVTERETGLSIISQPKSQSVSEGEEAVFTVEAEGNNISYQWQYSTNGKTWYNSGMTGAKTESLIVVATAKRNGQQYRCEITDANGEKLVSEAASLTVTERETGLSIISQPKSQSVPEGEEAVFTVEAEGDNISYQWKYSTNGKTWYNSGMTGAKTQNLTVVATAKRNGQQYRCEITDVNGEKLVSEAASLTVTERETGLSIISQPKSQSVPEGEEAVFTVEAEGDNISYQWQYSTNGKTWYNSGMTGAKTQNLTVVATAKRNGQQYRCVVTDLNGKQQISDAAVLTLE